jgi:hypothetical protein
MWKNTDFVVSVVVLRWQTLYKIAGIKQTLTLLLCEVGSVYLCRMDSLHFIIIILSVCCVIVPQQSLVQPAECPPLSIN